MSTALHCQNCGSVTDVSSMLGAFEENPHCPTCGLSISEADSKMQDDLADMMARNLRLSTVQAPMNDVSMPPTPQVLPQPAPITYISQHYHHSAHLAPSMSDVRKSASTILREAGVNADVLLPSQLQLFKNAEPEQQQRLIELWKISPPTYGNQMMAKNMGSWPQTSMAHEEEAARYRWEQQQQPQPQPQPQQDERSQNSNSYIGHEFRGNAEPYMSDGYNNLSNTNGIAAPSVYGSTTTTISNQRRSTDPVYASREWWHTEDYKQMAHQYGMLQQMQMQHRDGGSYSRTNGEDDMML